MGKKHEDEASGLVDHTWTTITEGLAELQSVRPQMLEIHVDVEAIWHNFSSEAALLEFLGKLKDIFDPS